MFEQLSHVSQRHLSPMYRFDVPLSIVGAVHRPYDVRFYTRTCIWLRIAQSSLSREQRNWQATNRRGSVRCRTDQQRISPDRGPGPAPAGWCLTSCARCRLGCRSDVPRSCFRGYWVALSEECWKRVRCRWILHASTLLRVRDCRSQFGQHDGNDVWNNDCDDYRDVCFPHCRADISTIRITYTPTIRGTDWDADCGSDKRLQWAGRPCRLLYCLWSCTTTALRRSASHGACPRYPVPRPLFGILLDNAISYTMYTARPWCLHAACRHCVFDRRLAVAVELGFHGGKELYQSSGRDAGRRQHVVSRGSGTVLKHGAVRGVVF
jgi:hypothetical protein